jgi:hypothetical protein
MDSVSRSIMQLLTFSALRRGRFVRRSDPPCDASISSIAGDYISSLTYAPLLLAVSVKTRTWRFQVARRWVQRAIRIWPLPLPSWTQSRLRKGSPLKRPKRWKMFKGHQTRARPIIPAEEIWQPQKHQSTRSTSKFG